MTDPEITALAREYAEETFKDDESNPDLPICLLNEIRQECAADFEEKLRWLLRRYCLVKESKVKQIYQAKQHILANQNVFGIIVATETAAQKRLMLYLFPEIAKEVEG